MKRKKKISWIHISDLQFGNKQIDCNVYNSLIKDIEDLNKEHPIDMIFVTGDLTMNNQHEQFDQAIAFLDRLSRTINLSKDYIFCVPGNHDAVRTGNDSSLINSLKTSEDVDAFISSSYIDLFCPKFEEYLSFVQKNFRWANKLRTTTLFFTENLIINDIRIAVIGINSSWAENIYESKVTIGENQLLEILSDIDNADITIALMHHPITKIRDFEKNSISEILQSRCDFVLHGHNDGHIKMFSPYNEMYFISAGNIYESHSSVFSYNLASVNIQKEEKSFLIFRKYDEIERRWSIDNFANANGNIAINLPLRLTTNIEDYIENKIDGYYAESNYFIDGLVVDVPAPPEYLIEAIKDKKCILFAGAGTSADAKLPNWAELVSGMTKMVEEVGEDQKSDAEEIKKMLEDKEYIILADFCKKKLGDFDFSGYIKRKLDVKDKTSLTHGLLSKIPFKSAVTTNFDSFIEKYKDNSKIVYPDDFEHGNIANVGSVNNNTFYIYKIHGSYDTPDSIVLTRSDFRNILFKKSKYKQQLKEMFLENVIFFYGYSFTDPDIDFLLQEIMAEYDGKARKHYALLPDIGNIKRDYLQREYNIRVIPYKTINGSHIAANEFLKKIIEKL